MSDTTYFSAAGRNNTEATARLAAGRAKEIGIRAIVMASNTGESALKALPFLDGIQLVVVTHSTGFRGPNTQEMSAETRSQLESLGARVLTCQHAFGGVNRAIRRKFNSYQIDEIIAHTLKVLGEGTKVACEIAMMAADAGLVCTDEEIVAIGGTGRGSDTALVVKPVNARDFFNLRIREIVCKPR